VLTRLPRFKGVTGPNGVSTVVLDSIQEEVYIHTCVAGFTSEENADIYARYMNTPSRISDNEYNDNPTYNSGVILLQKKSFSGSLISLYKNIAFHELKWSHYYTILNWKHRLRVRVRERRKIALQALPVVGVRDVMLSYL